MDYQPIPSDGHLLDDAAVRTFLHRYLRAWNAHDPDAVLALATDDVLWQDPTIPGGQAQGHAPVRAWLAAFWAGFPDMTFEFLDGADEHAGDAMYRSAGRIARMVLLQRQGGSLPPGFAPTGRAVELVGVDLDSFRNNRLCQVRTFTDTTTAALQLGLMPAAGSVGERLAVGTQRSYAHCCADCGNPCD